MVRKIRKRKRDVEEKGQSENENLNGGKRGR